MDDTPSLQAARDADYAAWREAMLKWQRDCEQHVTLRDTFAAAALTGLLAAPTDKDRSSEYWSRFSYEIADAMLRERDKTSAEKTSGSGSVTLTDAEREAIKGAIDVLQEEDQWHVVGESRIKTLRGLLERLG